MRRCLKHEAISDVQVIYSYICRSARVPRTLLWYVHLDILCISQGTNAHVNINHWAVRGALIKDGCGLPLLYMDSSLVVKYGHADTPCSISQAYDTPFDTRCCKPQLLHQSAQKTPTSCNELEAKQRCGACIHVLTHLQMGNRQSCMRRDMPFAAAATSSVHQYSRKVGEQLSGHLSSAWKKTSSSNSIRQIGEKLQSFKLA